MCVHARVCMCVHRGCVQMYKYINAYNRRHKFLSVICSLFIKYFENYHSCTNASYTVTKLGSVTGC